MIKRTLFFSVLFLMTFSSAAYADTVCLHNAYSGSIYNGKGVSFRVRACLSENSCSGWTRWDWLQRGRTRLVEYPSRGYADVEINKDGDNEIAIKSIRAIQTNPVESQCDGNDSWHFYETTTGKIWLFTGLP
jgi:hypothetical protein